MKRSRQLSLLQQEIFKELLNDVDLSKINAEQNKRLCKAMHLGFLGLLNVKTLIKLRDKLGKDAAVHDDTGLQTGR